MKSDNLLYRRKYIYINSHNLNFILITRFHPRSRFNMLFKIVTLFTLLSLSVASRAPFTRIGDEYVYKYEGVIKTTLMGPGFTSQFRTHADLHISPLEDGLWMTLKNVKYEVNSGENDSKKSERVAIPKDSESINIPFIYHRYQNESQHGITVHKDDMPWSKNMKQAMANLIFMDPRVFNMDKPTEFVHDDQHTYYVLPEENTIVVEKFKTQECYDMALEPKFKHHIEEHHILPMVKKQKYNFNIIESGIEYLSMSQLTNYDFYPFNGNSEKFFAQVVQDITKESISPAKGPQKFNRDNMAYVEIEFEPQMFLTGNGAYDYTMGRQPVDLDALTTSIKNDLEDLLKHSQKSHITLSESHLENKHSVDFLIHRLRNLDTAHLSKLYSSISNLSDDKLVNVLLQAMSLTGTPNPYFFIMDLISESKLSDAVSVNLLENMPKHVTQYYPKLVKRMWNLIEDTSTSKNVKSAALLSMSSILYWAKCEDKITETLIERLTKAKDDEEKILLMNVLRNINCATSDMALLNIAKDKSMIPHVRAVAMMGLKSGKHHDFLWLNLFNTTEHFEVRVMALHLLTDPQYPDHYDKVFWFVSGEDKDLSYFFKKKCESMSTTTINRYAETSARAKELLPNMDSESKIAFQSSNYFFDYVDSYFGFGTAALVTYYGDPLKYGFMSVHVQLLEQSTSPIWSQDEYYFHVRWTSEEPRKFQTIYDYFNGNYTGCIIDHSVVQENAVMSYSSIDLDEDISAFDILKEFLSFDESDLDIDQLLHTEIVIPTDMGLPLVFFNQRSEITKFDLKFKMEPNVNVTYNSNYHGNEVYGFSAYNPISNTWNGIRRVHTYDSYIPIDINVASIGKSLKFRINRGEDPFGFQSYVYSHVFLRSENDDWSNIKATCPECESFNLITAGEDDVENHVLWHLDSENTGFDYKYVVFNCEEHITASHSKQLMFTLETIFEDDDKNFESFPAVKPILGLHHLWKSMTLSPSTGMCGMGLMIKKSTNYPVTHIDFTVGYDQNQKSKETDMKFAYYMKNDDTLIKSWDVNFVYTKENNTEYDVKINAKSSKPGKPDYRFCLDVVDRWGYNQMTSDWTVLMGNDHDGKCPVDESRVKISMRGGMNDELKKIHKTVEKDFPDCAKSESIPFKDCIQGVSSYRSYDIDVEYEKLSKECMQWWVKVSDYFKYTLANEFVRMEHEEDSVKPGHLKFAINYPYYYSTVNVSVTTPMESYRYDDLVYLHYKWLRYVEPYSAFTKYNDDMLKYCHVGKNYVTDAEGGSQYNLHYGDDDWSELAHSCPNESGPCLWKIKSKRTPKGSLSDIMLHVQYEDEVLELTHDEDLIIHLNGEKMPLVSEERYHSGKRIDYMVLTNSVESHILVNLKNVDLTLYYNLNEVKMIMPYQKGQKSYGGLNFIIRFRTKSMSKMLFKIFTFFALLSLSSALRVPFAHNDDYVYDYWGKIVTTNNEPDFNSYCTVWAQLHISPLEDGLWMALENVNYEVYSGDTNKDTAERAPFPEHSESINIPFIYHRYENESQHGITVHKDDKLWSRNMKQGIANLIFLNSRSFTEKEPAEFIHEDNHTYYVLPGENNIVVKIFKAQEYYEPKFKTLEPKFKHHIEEHHILPLFKRQTSNIGVKGDRLELISTYYEETIEFYPFNGESERFSSIVQQTLKQTSVTPVKELQKINRDNMEYVEINFQPKKKNLDSGTYDFTMGRQPIDLDALTTSIKSDLESLLQFFQESHITLSKLYLERKHSIGFLIHRLRTLDSAHLSKLYSSISNLSDGKMANVLLQAMSLTGTPDPYFFIIDLISESKLNEDVSVQLLENMSKHVTQYYPKLVKKMWNLIEDKSTSKKVYNSAVLSMSLILYWSECEDRMTETLIEKLTKAENDDQRILFINALRNIRCEKYDMAILNVAEDNSMVPHIRAMAMMGLKSGKHHGFLWLNLFNTTEHFEVRVVALHLLSDPRYPDHFDKIFWFLSSSEDNGLKHFFMKKCESLATTTIKHYSEASARAKDLIPQMQWGSKSKLTNSNYLFDYMDSSYEFGAAALITSYGDLTKHGFISVHVQLLQQSIIPVWSQSEYYFHIRCPIGTMKNIETILDIMDEDFNECVFDRLTIRNEDVIQIAKLPIEIMEQLLNWDISDLDIDQPLNTEIVIPNAMGLPIIFFNQKSQIKKTNAKVDMTKCDVNMKYHGNEIYGFSTYNPISNTWHGIRRVHISEAYIPIDINYVPNDKSVKIQIKRGEDAFGFQSYVYNHVFMHSANDDESIIKASCPNCEPYTIITKGDESIESHVLWENDGEDTGLDCKLAIFDCEDNITVSHNKQIKQTIQTMLDYSNKNFERFPAVKPILALHNLWSSMILSPKTGMCGTGLMIKKSKNNPVTHIDLTVGIQTNTSSPKFEESDIKLAYYLKNDETLIKSWDVSFVSTEENNTEYDIKINAKSSKPGKPNYRFCLDVVDKWGYNHMTSHWTALMGNDADGQCPKDETKIKISMKAEMNKDLKEIQNSLGQYFTLCDDRNDKSLGDCIQYLSSYRSYDIDVEYEKLSKSSKRWWTTISDFFKLTFSDEFVRMEHQEDSTKPGHVKITVNYPFFYDSINVSVVTPMESYRYDDVGYDSLKWLPYVLPYSAFVKYGDEMLIYCEAGEDYVKDSQGGYKFKLNYGDDGWSQLAHTCPTGDGPCTNKWNIKIKRDWNVTDKSTENDIMVHVQAGDEVLELSYAKNDLEIHMNGKKMPLVSKERYHYGEEIDYMVLSDTEKSNILVHLRIVGLTLFYDSLKVKMVLPFQEGHTSYMGQCKINHKTKTPNF
ncbi:uncharacterized protein LOC143909191 [Arctopsyche grandis]|uniref:uncharacterized protein LOC143909191 n=1 Tax=Arctopsyche grandis TaxID=121162 RepID=UPI00406D9F18